jgi:hypothetical protein
LLHRSSDIMDGKLTRRNEIFLLNDLQNFIQKKLDIGMVAVFISCDVLLEKLWQTFCTLQYRSAFPRNLATKLDKYAYPAIIF